MPETKSSCKYQARALPEPVISKCCLLQQQELAMPAKWTVGTVRAWDCLDPSGPSLGLFRPKVPGYSHL